MNLIVNQPWSYKHTIFTRVKSPIVKIPVELNFIDLMKNKRLRNKEDTTAKVKTRIGVRKC